jgi:RNase P subunit RPR2
MEKGISEIVGRATRDDGGSTEVYRALRALMCATCGASLSQGTLFTRRKVKGIGLRILPQCGKCAPFTLQTDKKERSALIQSLLSEQPTDSTNRASASARANSQSNPQSASERKNLDDEVRRRLEPALKRGRQGRFQK